MIWVLYDIPSGFAGHLKLRYVAREFDGAAEATGHVIAEASLERVRQAMRELGLTPLPPVPGDDPRIVETWS